MSASVVRGQRKCEVELSFRRCPIPLMLPTQHRKRVVGFAYAVVQFQGFAQGFLCRSIGTFWRYLTERRQIDVALCKPRVTQRKTGIFLDGFFEVALRRFEFLRR